MFSKRFLMSLLAVGLLSCSMAACDDDNNDNPCDGKKAGDVCGENKVCNDKLACVDKPADADPCKGKKEDDACGENKICDAQLKCVDKPADADPCKGKKEDDACGENKICDAQLKCVDKPAENPCKGKTKGEECGTDKVCDPVGKCVGKADTCEVKEVGDYCGEDFTKMCNQNKECVEIKLPAKLIKSSAAHEASNISDDALAIFVKDQYDLNFDLIRASENQLGGNNAMISIFSIQTALGMVWAGADGDTKSQMASVLHFGDDAHSALNKINAQILSLNKAPLKNEYYDLDAQEIKTSNNLYYMADAYKWADTWKDLLARNYDAGIWEMDFAADPEAARQYINGVVSKDTRDRIKDLIPKGGIIPETRSVITNAIYFKSPWGTEVKESESKLSFTKSDGSKVQADALVANEYYKYVKGEDYQAVALPLRDNDFNVLFVLPDEGKFGDIQEKLNGEMVMKIFKDASSANVEMKFPSIEYTTSVELNDPLKQLGMKDPFDPGVANFSKMTTDLNNLFISAIFHKSFIAMNKHGVEAAAATAVVVSDTAIGGDSVEVVLDRPYYYVVYESKTLSPLFVGRVMDPTAE